MTNKKLMALGIAWTAVTLGGCCKVCDPPITCPDCTELNKDIVYAIDIPNEQKDCPAGTKFVDVSSGTNIHGLGGSGIVDRGGSGIVDRDGARVKQFCYQACTPPEQPVGSEAYPIWNSHDQFIVAESNCALISQ